MYYSRYVNIQLIQTYHLLIFEDPAPRPPRQVIDQTGHTKSVDWWTLGVLLFELLAGALGGNPQEAA